MKNRKLYQEATVPPLTQEELLDMEIGWAREDVKEARLAFREARNKLTALRTEKRPKVPAPVATDEEKGSKP